MTPANHSIVIGFYGYSNSGKTTLLERLIYELSKEGYQVAAVKRTNKQIHFDKEGKDTRRFALAGANPVVFSSPLETIVVNCNKWHENQIIQELEIAYKPDFIFIEGSREANIQKIRIGEHELRENTILTYNGNFEFLLDFLKNKLFMEVKNG